MYDRVIPPVCSILSARKIVSKAENYFKYLWRSEMAAKSLWVKFSALATFSISWGHVDGAGITQWATCQAACPCAALLADQSCCCMRTRQMSYI